MGYLACAACLIIDWFDWLPSGSLELPEAKDDTETSRRKGGEESPIRADEERIRADESR